MKIECLLRPLVFAAALLALSPISQPAIAFELFGLKFFESDKPDDADVIGEPQAYSVDLSVSGDESDVRKAVEGASSLWKDREKPASGAAGLVAKARGDYRRILAVLYTQARYGGTISIRIDGREAADLPPDTELADPASVTVSVDPGPLFKFGSTDIVNRAPPAANRRDVVDDPVEAGFEPGEIARSGVVLQAERLSVAAWKQQGHAKAEIIERRIEAAHDRDILDATLVVEPGPKASYGETTVQGTERMDPGFVAYMTDLPVGQEYDPDDIERANKRLARLDVFRSQRIVEAGAIGNDGLLPISVIIQERKRRRFGVGGSYSTLDGAGLEAYWLHRNLFGKAERLRFDAKIAGIGSKARNGSAFDPKDLTYRLGATFTKPGVFTPDTDFIASVFGDREVLDPYTRTAVTAQAGFNHMFSEEVSARLFANFSVARFDDDFGRRDFTTAGLLGGVTFDNRDNAADATKGFYLDGTLEPFYEFNYGNAALRMTAEGRAYYGFGRDDTIVAAGRIKVGSIVGAPISEIAPDRLFFAGGGGSVRGYGYNNIGVVSPGGAISGGRSLIEGSAELRARVTQSIGLVGFADAGYVGANSFPDFSQKLKLGAGVGLRYLTGLGPIRLDVAVPLNGDSNDPDFAFYVGIGQAF